jgi:hypothetical protein
VKGKDSFDCAIIIYEIGLLCQKKKKMIEALNYYNRAQMIYEKTGAKPSKIYALLL